MIIEKDFKSGISKTAGGINHFIKGLPTRISTNPYIGCTHCCIYCYNKFLIRFRKEYDKLDDTCNKIIVKRNLPELITDEINKIKKSVLWIGSISDPYQPIEKKYEITRKIIKILKTNEFPYSIYTKSDLIVRDLDIIKDSLSEVIFTITSIDNNFKKKFEPYSPSYDRVLNAVEEISKITDTRVAILPIIPQYNDDIESLKYIMKEVKERGVKNVFVGFLRLNPLTTKNMKEKLGNEFDKIREYYGETFAGALIPKEEYRKNILKNLYEFSKEINVGFYVEDPLYFYNKKRTKIDKFYYATYQDFLYYYKKIKNIEKAYKLLNKDFLVDISLEDLIKIIGK